LKERSGTINTAASATYKLPNRNNLRQFVIDSRKNEVFRLVENNVNYSAGFLKNQCFFSYLAVVNSGQAQQ
jgi:hypothetical protein